MIDVVFTGILATVLLVAAAVIWIQWRPVVYSGHTWRPYRVTAGDSFSVLAARCQISRARLARMNGLKPPYRLAPGDMLLVPPNAKVPTESPLPATGRTVHHATTPGRQRRRGVPWPWLWLGAFGVVSVLLAAGKTLIALSGGKVPSVEPNKAATVPFVPPAVPLSAVSATTTPDAGSVPATTTVQHIAVKDTVVVTVLNGSGESGVARRVAEKLRLEGYRQVSTGNADVFTYHGLTIRYRPDARDAAEALAALLRPSYHDASLNLQATATGDIDLVVIIGKVNASSDVTPSR